MGGRWRSSGPGRFQNGRLEGLPTDGGAFLTKKLSDSGTVTALEIEWDGTLAYSYWGAYTQARFIMLDGSKFSVLHLMVDYSFGLQNAVSFRTPDDQQWQDTENYTYPLEYGTFHHRLIVRDQEVRFIVTRSSNGAEVFDHTEPMSGLYLSLIDELKLGAYATTDNGVWMDNIEVQWCASGSPPSAGDGLVAYYPLDGNANDASGNGYDGILVGDVAFSDGVEGAAALFDGMDDRITINGKVPYQDEFTFSGWMRFLGPPQNDGAFLFVKAASCNLAMQSLNYVYSSNYIHVDVADFGSPWYLRATTVLTDGEWYHLTTTVKPGEVRIYLDGVMIAEEPLTGTIDTDNCYIEHAIGGFPAGLLGGPWSHNGLIDEVRIYNRALSAAEVAQLADGEVSGTSPNASFIWSPTNPTAGTSVTFSDTSTGSSGPGSWDLDSDGKWDAQASSVTHTFDRPGVHPVTLEVENAFGTDKVTRNISVSQQTSSSEPYVISVQRQYPGFFLDGISLNNIFEVFVDWQGSKGDVEVEINDGSGITATGTSTGAEVTFDMGTDINPSWQGTSVTFTPVNGEGVRGDSWSEEIWVFPYPWWLEQTLAIGGKDNYLKFNTSGNEVTAEMKAEFPIPRIKAEVDIPSYVPYIAGKLGIKETYGVISGEISSKGTGNLSLYGQTGFSAMDQEISGKVGGSGEFTLVPPDGAALEKASFTLGLSGKITDKKGIIDAIPQLAFLADLGPIANINKLVSLKGEISPSLELTASFRQQSGKLVFDDGTGTLGLKLKVSLIAQPIKAITLTGWVGGGGSFTLGFPEPYLRAAEINVEAGVEYKVKWLFVTYGGEFRCRAWCEWRPDTGIDCPTDCGSKRAPLWADGSGPVTLYHVPYDDYGTYSKIVQMPIANRSRSVIPVSTLQTTLLTNVFPGASPTFAETGSEEVLLWIHQDPSDPVVQSTDIGWSIDDGGGWSAPTVFADDTRAEFDPTIGVDGSGEVVAVWTRIRDTAFSTPINEVADLPLFLSRLDVVSATLNPSAGTWSAITSLTDDTAYDLDPQLGELDSGDLLLTWISNADGELLSTAFSTSDLYFRVWDSSTGTWGGTATVASGIDGIASHAAATCGSSAFVILPRDPDSGVVGDSQLELLTWNGATWSGRSVYAAGGVDNHSPAVTCDTSDEGHVVWVRDGDLVHATVSDQTPAVIRPASDSIAFTDTRLEVNTSGVITLLWSEAVEGTANLFACLYDPVNDLWSEDRRLTAEDEVIHRDLDAVYGSDGVLRGAYLATHVNRVTQDVEIDSKTYTFENIPDLAATDLRFLEHSLVVDLAVDGGDLAVSPTQPVSGDDVSCLLTVHNAGDFATDSFLVGLYVGDPDTGGTLVSSATVTGPFAAGAAEQLDLSFTHAGDAGNIVAVVDSSLQVTEITESNNRVTWYVDNTAPDAHLLASVTSGEPPLTVDFDASQTTDAEGDNMSHGWAFGDGSADGTGETTTHTFTTSGQYPVTLAVTDEHGAVGTAVVVITVSGDGDGDLVPDLVDNCPGIANTDQTDTNFDGFGDACQHLVSVFGDDFESGDTSAWSATKR